MFSLICVWINGWVNNREAGDLRRHCGHYDVNVMICCVNEKIQYHFWLYKSVIYRPSDFFQNNDLTNHFHSVLSKSYVSIAYLRMCAYILIWCGGFGKTALQRWTCPKMSILTRLPIIYSKYTKLILSKHTSIQDIYQSIVVVRIWLSVLKPVKFYSAKCAKMSTGPNSHGTRRIGKHHCTNMLLYKKWGTITTLTLRNM